MGNSASPASTGTSRWVGVVSSNNFYRNIFTLPNSFYKLSEWAAHQQNIVATEIGKSREKKAPAENQGHTKLYADHAANSCCCIWALGLALCFLEATIKKELDLFQNSVWKEEPNPLLRGSKIFPSFIFQISHMGLDAKNHVWCGL